MGAPIKRANQRDHPKNHLGTTFCRNAELGRGHIFSKCRKFRPQCPKIIRVTFALSSLYVCICIYIYNTYIYIVMFDKLPMMKNDDKPWESLPIIILYHHLPYFQLVIFHGVSPIEATCGAWQGGDWPLSQVFLAGSVDGTAAVGM